MVMFVLISSSTKDVNTRSLWRGPRASPARGIRAVMFEDDRCFRMSNKTREHKTE